MEVGRPLVIRHCWYLGLIASSKHKVPLGKPVHQDQEKHSITIIQRMMSMLVTEIPTEGPSGPIAQLQSLTPHHQVGRSLEVQSMV